MARVYNRVGRALMPTSFVWRTGASASREPGIERTNSLSNLRAPMTVFRAVPASRFRFATGLKYCSELQAAGVGDFYEVARSSGSRHAVLRGDCRRSPGVRPLADRIPRANVCPYDLAG